jgi:hypothetical protein
MRAAWLALSLSMMTVAPAARAWTDARPAGLVTEVVVDRDGGATVTLRVRWRVVAGRFRAFDLTELPSDATLVEATATDAQGAPVTVATRAPQPGRMEVTLGESEGLRRGTVDVVVRYTTSLRAQDAIRRSGDDAIVEVATVPWERGLEAAELRVATPTSIQRARWVQDDTPGIETAVTSEVGRDVVRAVRRHLPAGARWSARIACDRALFPWLEAPSAPARAEAQAAERDRWVQPAAVGALALAFAAFAEKLRRREPRTPRLLPLPARARWLPVALAAAGAAWMSTALDATQGALAGGSLVALVGLLAAAPSLDPLPPAATGRAVWWEQSRVDARADRAPARWRPWLALAVAMLLGWAGYAARSAPLSLFGVAASVALLGWLVASRERAARSDLAVLADVAKGVRIPAKSSTRLAWRVRDEGVGVGAAKLKIASRPGYRASKGLEAIEWCVERSASWLRWEAQPLLIVRARRGSAMEKTLRLAATRVGRLVVGTDGERLAWVVQWAGAERAVARETLAHIVREGYRPFKPAHTLPESAEHESTAAADAIDA